MPFSRLVGRPGQIDKVTKLLDKCYVEEEEKLPWQRKFGHGLEKGSTVCSVVKLQ